MSQTSKATNTRPGNVALHQKLRPQAAQESQQKMTLGQNVDQQILQAVGGNFNEKTVRTKLLQIAMNAGGAIGVCFLTKDVQDHWAPSISSPTVGRVPDRRAFASAFSEKCEQFAQTNAVHTENLPSLKNSLGVFAPVRARNSEPEIMLLVANSQQESLLAMSTLQKIATAMQLWLNGRDSADSEWQVHALGSIIELVAKIENQPSLKSAAEETTNLLANRIGCSSVAIGLFKKDKLRLEAISGVSKLDRGSETSRNYLQALVESTTRKRSGLYPAKDSENNFLLQAHKQLGSSSQCEAVFSQPLINDDDVVIGSIIMTGKNSILESSQVARFCGTAAPAVANAFRVVERAKQTTIKRTKAYVKRKVSVAKQLMALALIVGFCLLMVLPVTYRVRCNCITEPVSRRFAVAPFDGQILTGFVEAGDLVTKDQVLAEMDGRTIRWKLSGVTAEREQSLLTRRMKLADRNVPETILSELEYDRLVSEEEILQYKKEHLQIRSPIDGVVLSGSLERAEAASIETGQVLFEIGPVNPMRIEVAIPSEEIAQVQSGFGVKVWIDGQEDDPIEGEIKKIHPRSETRDAKNVFIAQIEFANEDERLRPGMKGSVRIDCEKRSLGWSLFHKPINYVRARLTWW